MSPEALKLEKDLCRCCHLEGDFKSLYAPYYWLEKERVVYYEMLQECFNIELVPATEPLNYMICGICNVCTQKLHDAMLFKRQVEKCEKQFRDVYLEHVCKAVSTFEVPVKEEIIDLGDCGEVNGVCLNGVIKDDLDSNKLSDDGRMADDYDDGRMADDDGVNSDHGADKALKLNDEEDRATPGRKRGPHKKKKGATSKVKKKKSSRHKIREKTAPPKDKDIVGTIAGIIDVVRRPYPVQIDIDYKQVGDIYQCCKCDKEHKSSKGIRDHVAKIHLKIPKYSCPECSKSFLTLAPFNKHKVEEHNIDHRYKCNACDNIFNTKVQLKRHNNSFHMLGVQYKCDVCDYESFSIESLYKHKFKHRTVKDFHCKYCRKSFMRKTTLQLHERIHTGDRRKICNVCGQAFVQKASLNYHMTKYHPGEKF